jgi:hypothetical protein
MSGLEIKQKRKLHLFRWFILLVILITIGIYVFFIMRWHKTGDPSPLPLPFAMADASIDESRISRDQVEDYKVSASEPRYLIIDDFLIKSRVKHADLDERSMFTMPNNLDDVVWYEKSAKPGSGVGSVVVSGRNIGVTRDGTFSKLTDMSQGDELKIERGDGKVVRYEIHIIEEKPLEWVNKVGMNQMMSSIDPSKEGLSLIASSGRWVPSQKEFDSRIIVRAVAKNDMVKKAER